MVVSGAEKCFETSSCYNIKIGYAGGDTHNQLYEVCSGLTGHSEVVRVIWDKNKIDVSDLLKMFWECRDYNQKNKRITIWVPI